jgi:hypothetical protein
MADLVNAFNKLNDKLNTSSLKYYIAKRCIIDENEELKKNDSEEYEWQENMIKKEQSMVVIELPYGKEFKWELFGDNHQTDTGTLLFDKMMKNRLLTIIIEEDNINLFFKLYVKTENNNDIPILYEKALENQNILKNEYNCFINLNKDNQNNKIILN